MSCSEYQKHLRPWLRGELSGADAVAVEKHISGCYFCASVVEKESAVLDTLQANYKIPEPSSDFYARVMSAATNQSMDKNRPLFGLPATGMAVAAALALGIALGVGFQPNVPAGSEASAQAEVASDPTAGNLQTVRLAFNTAKAMENVTLTVQLPAHVEVSGYPGYQRLSWSVSLDRGENIVRLPLNVLFPGEGQLVAHLDDGQRQKTFRTQLSQTESLNNLTGSPDMLDSEL